MIFKKKVDEQKSTTPIWLVVGFLGAGKTTLLRRLVNSEHGKDYIYVVNEFSAVDVDAGQIEREGGARPLRWRAVRSSAVVWYRSLSR